MNNFLLIYKKRIENVWTNEWETFESFDQVLDHLKYLANLEYRNVNFDDAKIFEVAHLCEDDFSGYQAIVNRKLAENDCVPLTSPVRPN